MTRSLTLRVAGRTLHAEARRRGRVVWQGEIGYEDPNELKEVIAQLAAEPKLDRRFRHVLVELEPPVLQLRTLADLPPVNGRTLRQLVDSHAARYFRKNGEPLVTDACWLSSGTPRAARLAAAEHLVLTAILTGASEAGLRVIDIVPAGNGARKLSLLPPAIQRARLRSRKLSLRRLAAVAAALWIGVAAVYLTGQTRDRLRIESELDSLRPAITAMAAARREIAGARQMVTAIRNEAAARTRVLRLLGSLTAALPDSAFLTSFTMSVGNSGMLTGYAPGAAQLVAALEKTGLLGRVRLEGQSTREVIGGRTWDRFTIAFGESSP